VGRQYLEEIGKTDNGIVLVTLVKDQRAQNKKRSPEQQFIQLNLGSDRKKLTSILNQPCIALINSAATSGRENSGGGSSPRRNISLTFVPDR
jgi:hypothetical protein